MDQIALPYRVVLIAVLALCAIWFVALRPKPTSGGSDAPAAAKTAPGVKGLSTAIDKAKTAGPTSDAANARVQKATGAPGGAAAAPAAASPGAQAASPHAAATATPPAAGPATAAAPDEPKPKPTAADPSARVIAALAHGNVAAVLFYNAQAADDRHVHRALKGADRHGGHVLLTAVPIAKVGQYEAITRGVEILQGPTLLVIGPDRRARTIVGLTDTKEIDQLISDVRRAQKPVQKR